MRYIYLTAVYLLAATTVAPQVCTTDATHTITISFKTQEQLNHELHQAAKGGNKPKVQVLIKNGADPNAQDLLQRTPLHFSLLEGHTDIAKLLIQHGATPNVRKSLQEAVHVVSDEGPPDITKLLIENGADPNAQDSHKETPLHETSDRGHTDIAALLIENGADPNAQDLLQRTPLHETSDRGHTKIAKLLIQHSADPNVQDHLQATPLHETSDRGHTKIAKLLIQNSADPNTQDFLQRTPLFLASEKGYTEIAKLLINNGADPSLHNKHGETPYAFANNEEIKNYMDQVQKICNGNIDEVITNETPREDALSYAKASIGQGVTNSAWTIIQTYLGNLSADEYTDIQRHAIRNFMRMRNANIHKLVENIRNQYETEEYRTALVDTAWKDVRDSSESPHIIRYILNTYPDTCRNYCDDRGNTVFHIAARNRQLNPELPYIATLVMQNKNHNHRNNNEKTPVMIARECGNNEGANIIKATSRMPHEVLHSKKKNIPTQSTRMAYQLTKYMPHMANHITTYDHVRKSLNDLVNENIEHIIKFIPGNEMQQMTRQNNSSSHQ